MRFVNKLFSLSILVAGIIACGHNRVVADSESNQVGKKGVMTVYPKWVKEKQKKFDMQVVLQNQSTFAQIVWLKDVQCSRGSVKGDVEMVGALGRHGDVPIWLRPDTSQTVIFVCDLGAEGVKGTYKVNVSKVYDNPNGDGRTVGKLVAKDLAIEQEAKAKR